MCVAWRREQLSGLRRGAAEQGLRGVCPADEGERDGTGRVAARSGRCSQAPGRPERADALMPVHTPPLHRSRAGPARPPGENRQADGPGP